MNPRRALSGRPSPCPQALDLQRRKFFGTALLSMGPMQLLWACWCEDNQRILIGELSGDHAAIAEVEISANLNLSGPTRTA